MSVEQARQELVEQMLRATTEEEVRAATEAADAWLKKHPNDVTVLLAGEQLTMIEHGLQFMKEQKQRQSA